MKDKLAYVEKLLEKTVVCAFSLNKTICITFN